MDKDNARVVLTETVNPPEWPQFRVMISPFRTLSALVRQDWLIDPAFAEQHLPLIDAYLKGDLANENSIASLRALKAEAPAGYFLSAQNKISSSGRSRIPIFGRLAAATGGEERSLVRHEIAGEDEIPDNSVFVLDIRGAIFKEGSCCAYGTEDYVRLLNAAYDNDKIIGNVVLVDSPGGQLSGTPTLYDTLKDPRKPTVTVINEGLMASAAYWLACGSDFIYATQKTDQVGSIGVFVQFQDRTEQNKQLGITTRTIYSDRSTEKNLPYREAMKGNEKPLKDDLNQAADLFREAVEAGRGDRLKPATEETDVFKGGVFYASKAIELGLIDGFGNLDTAVAKVYELAAARKDGKPTVQESTSVQNPQNSSAQGIAPAAATTPVVVDTPEPTAGLVPTPTTSNQNPNSMFGYVQLAALSAIKGVAAADVTEAQVNAINAAFAEQGYAVSVINQAQFEQASKLQGDLNAATGKITTLTKERDDAVAKAAEFGGQPGVMGSKGQKVEEPTAPEATGDADISEADAELQDMRRKMGFIK